MSSFLHHKEIYKDGRVQVDNRMEIFSNKRLKVYNPAVFTWNRVKHSISSRLEYVELKYGQPEFDLCGCSVVVLMIRMFRKYTFFPSSGS